MTQAAVLDAIGFYCEDELLLGILHRPASPGTRGMLIVTGGPQYRIGSHRQFVLLGHQLAAAGIPVLRFDYRGMGDSGGSPRDFGCIGADLGCALDEFFTRVPGMREVVLWGLCDGGTAAALYAARDTRVQGLILLNPWVRTSQGLAQATLRHYYWRRLLQPSFWRKLAGGGLNAATALRSLRQLRASAASRDHANAQDAGSLPRQLYAALASFRGPVLIVLSGADLGEREFMALGQQHAHWRQWLNQTRVRQCVIARANHTFASRDWRRQVEQLCLEWMTSW